MAFDHNATRFLLYARHLGVDYMNTAMIGRQRLQLSARQLAANLRLFGQPADETLVGELLQSEDGYSERLLGHLGASAVHSFDCTSYEGATHAHDMNTPIAAEHKERYTLVLNGGSLEHVFNFPVAVRNCMEMVAVGGHFLTMGPANNWMGHGFYQFSPELFFRLFNGNNGYRLVRLLACEAGPRAVWFTVRDPEIIRKRVGVVSRSRITLLVLAQRTERSAVLKTMPQQSDYVSAWSGPGKAALHQAKNPSWSRQLRRRVKSVVRRVLAYDYGSFDPRLFERLDLARELRLPAAQSPARPKRNR